MYFLTPYYGSSLPLYSALLYFSTSFHSATIKMRVEMEKTAPSREPW